VVLAGKDTPDALRFGKWGPFSGSGAVMNAVSGRRTDRVRWLLQHGADPNRNDDWWTPLHMAAANGELEMVRLLLDYHADASIRSSREITPLEAALENGQQKVADLLRQRANIPVTAEGH